MEIITIVFWILGVHIFAWLTPGPMFFLIVSNSLKYWKVTWMWNAIGIWFWNFIHVLYSIIWVYFLNEFSKDILTIVGILGALYLCYLWVKVFLSESSGAKDLMIKEWKADLHWGKAFREWLYLNLLSPKASLFFGSIIAWISQSDSSSVIMWILLIMLPLNSFIMAYILSLFFTQEPIRNKYKKHHNTVNKLLWSTLLWFWLMLLYYSLS